MVSTISSFFIGNPLTPVSWQEMQDTVTGEREKRKVAKPDDA
jgi:exosome complex component CSL4